MGFQSLLIVIIQLAYRVLNVFLFNLELIVDNVSPPLLHQFVDVSRIQLSKSCPEAFHLLLQLGDSEFLNVDESLKLYFRLGRVSDGIELLSVVRKDEGIPIIWELVGSFFCELHPFDLVDFEVSLESSQMLVMDAINIRDIS